MYILYLNVSKDEIDLDKIDLFREVYDFTLGNIDHESYNIENNKTVAFYYTGSCRDFLNNRFRQINNIINYEDFKYNWLATINYKYKSKPRKENVGFLEQLFGVERVSDEPLVYHVDAFLDSTVITSLFWFFFKYSKLRAKKVDFRELSTIVDKFDFGDTRRTRSSYTYTMYLLTLFSYSLAVNYPDIFNDFLKETEESVAGIMETMARFLRCGGNQKLRKTIFLLLGEFADEHDIDLNVKRVVSTHDSKINGISFHTYQDGLDIYREVKSEEESLDW